jgi:hypothetical protein
MKDIYDEKLLFFIGRGIFLFLHELMQRHLIIIIHGLLIEQ